MSTSQRIEQSFIDELLSRVDIVELIDSKVSLRKQGMNYSANCPFHQENTPSFTVSSQKQFYHCFGCKVSGNSITFVMEFEHLNFIEAIEKLTSLVGLEMPKGSSQDIGDTKNLYNVLENSSTYYQETLRNHTISKSAIDYLKQRSITGASAKLFRIGFVPDGWKNLIDHLKNKKYNLQDIEDSGLAILQSPQKNYDRFRNRIMFPIRNHRGQIVGFGGRCIGNDNPKYLNSSETKIFHKAKVLYGLYESIQANKNLDQVVVVEGYLDVVQLHQNAIPYAVATLGTATTLDHIKLLTRFTKKIIFCFDGDKAGKLAAKKALLTCLPNLQDNMEICFVFLPQGEDPDSYVVKNGTEKFKQMLTSAYSLDEYFYQAMGENLNLSETSGRAKLIANVMPLLASIPNNATKHMLFNHLSRLVHINVDELKTYQTQPTMPAIKEESSPLSIQRTTIWLLSALLLQNIQLRPRVSPKSLETLSTYPKSKLFIALVKLIDSNSELSTAAIVERWRDHPQWEFINKLALWDTGIHQAGIDAEFDGLLNKIEQQSFDLQINKLLKKCNTPGLNEQERILLKNLIKQQKGL